MEEKEEGDDRDETLCRLSFKSSLELFTGAARNLFRMHTTEGEVPGRVNALSVRNAAVADKFIANINLSRYANRAVFNAPEIKVPKG